MTEPDYISATEAARRLGITDTAIRKRIKRGTIAATKIGREWRIPVAQLPDGSVAKPNHEGIGSVTEPNHEGIGSVAEPDSPDTEPQEFGDRTSRDHDSFVEDGGAAQPAEDSPPIARYEYEGLEVENSLLKLKLESVEREHQSTQRHLDSVLGEIDHLRAVNERLSVAVTNEQVLRLNSSPPSDAVSASTIDVDDAEEAPEPGEASKTTQDGADRPVTIRGSRPRGLLARLFGAR